MEPPANPTYNNYTNKYIPIQGCISREDNATYYLPGTGTLEGLLCYPPFIFVTKKH